MRKQFENRKGHGNVEERWKEMKHVIMKLATQHLQRKEQVRKRWISEDTLKLIEEKHQAFGEWQEEYTKCSQTQRVHQLL